MEHAYAVEVTATKDTRISVEKVVAQQDHLTDEQKQGLLFVLEKYLKLFDDSLGRYLKRKFHIELKDDAVPYLFKGPYSLPAVNMPALKTKIKRQENIGILERVGEL